MKYEDGTLIFSTFSDFKTALGTTSTLSSLDAPKETFKVLEKAMSTM